MRDVYTRVLRSLLGRTVAVLLLVGAPGAALSFHSADYNPADWSVNLSELLRAIQFYNVGAYCCDPQGEDGYAPGTGDHTCAPHDGDYNVQDWTVNLSELLRLIQFYNVGVYHEDSSGEDGYAPGPTTNQAPTASFTATPNAGVAPLEVTFDASGSSDPEGDLAAFDWDFGEGNTGTGMTVTHTYQTSGNYTVTLTVTDGQGATDVTTVSIAVFATNQQPTASFTATPNAGVAPLEVAFDASGSSDPEGDLAAFDWDFGEGNTGAGVTAVHTYPSAGDYAVTLTVTDGLGATDTVTIQITVVAAYVIQGTVYGNGLPLDGALGTAGGGDVPFSTTAGTFSVELGPDDIVSGTDGTHFPVTVQMGGFATGHGKVPVVSGQVAYDHSVVLLPVSYHIAPGEDVTTGVSIAKMGKPVGELRIPASSFPPGVSAIRGSITYLDPTTAEADSAPGGPFTGTPAVSAPGDPPQYIDSLGAMEFNLVDNWGSPVTTLAGPATVCSKIPDGLTGLVSPGETVPAWYFDPTTGQWIRDGSFTVEDRSPDGWWACGQVDHFTWWSYGTAYERVIGVVFSFINETNGMGENNLRRWAEYRRRIYNFFISDYVIQTFTAQSQRNPCGIPLACPADDILCLTGYPHFTIWDQNLVDPEGKPILRAEFLVYELWDGIRYWLRYDVDKDGNRDGTYSRTTDRALATQFTNPEGEPSCDGTTPASVRYLDDSDPRCDPYTGPECGNDGLLPIPPLVLGGPVPIGAPPSILIITADPTGPFLPEEISSLTATIIDPNGDGILPPAWFVACVSPSGVEAAATVVDTGSSGDQYSASFTAPLASAVPADGLFCTVTIRATDLLGNSRDASTTLMVEPEGSTPGCPGCPGQCGVTGILFGTDGARASGLPVRLSGNNFCSNAAYDEVVLTDANGNYSFPGVPCCEPCALSSAFTGTISVDFVHGGVPWTYTQGISVEGGPSCPVFGCDRNIYLPVLWGQVSGAVLPPETPTSFFVDNWQVYSTDFFAPKYSGEISVRPDGSYGPVEIPVGSFELLRPPDVTPRKIRDVQVLHAGQDLTIDLGASALGTVQGTVYGDDGAAVAGVTVNLGFGTGVPQATTSAAGTYSFAGVPLGRIFLSTVLPQGQRYGYGTLNHEGETVTIDINAVGCEVSGLFYTPLRNPFPAQTLELSIGNGGPWVPPPTATTNTNGVFLFENMASGNGILTPQNFIDYAVSFPLDTCSDGPFVVDLVAPPASWGTCGGAYLPIP